MRQLRTATPAAPRRPSPLALDVPLTALTFVCQEGQTQRNISIQLLPDTLAKLRDVCDRILRG